MSKWIRNLAYELQYVDYPDYYVVDHTLLKRRSKEILIIVLSALLVLIGGLFFSSELKRTGAFSWLKKAQFVGEAVVNSEVQAYEPMIRQYAEQYGISEYVPVLMAMMQQESGGRGQDVMQCSECYYNTKYEQVPGAIDDPEYSVDTGVHYFADCLELAGVTGTEDMTHLRLALQGYNFGTYYITWAIQRDGGYTKENAESFSAKMKAELGWEVYGDTNYPEHVLRYYR